MKLIEFFLSLRIRIKLLLAFGSIMLLSAIMVIMIWQTFTNIGEYKKISEEVDAVNIHILEMDMAAQYFMLEAFKQEDFQKDGINLYTDTYRQHDDTVRTLLAGIGGEQGFFQQDTLTASIKDRVGRIAQRFNSLQELLRKRGFKDYGLEGELRRAIHAVENSSFPYDKVDMLMLRRHEKDFFLRKDMKYPQEFNNKVGEFTARIATEHEGPEKDDILEKIAAYQKQFNEVVAIDSVIGLKDTGGLKGLIRNDLIGLKASIGMLRTKVKVFSDAYARKRIIFVGILFLVQLGLGIVLAFVYADILSRAIKEIRQAMKSLADGIFPGKMPIKTTEEIGDTKQAFNQLLDRMQAATSFSEALGNGELSSRYDTNFREDVLARSLIKMQDKLNEAQDRQAMIHWANEGTALFSELLKNQAEDTVALVDNLLKHLVKYVGMNQGALYSVVDQAGERYLNRLATFAYERKRFVSQRLDPDQGIIGQCIAEGNTIVLTDIPVGYVQITSGLGEATPRYIIVLPLKMRDDVVGAIELAGFHSLKPHQVQFLEKIAEYVASALGSRRVYDDTQKLLAEARENNQRLQAQEEEIRQHAEEMQAMQEDMTRQQRMLEEEIRTLKMNGTLQSVN
jgi:HAMP domain-containing protein